MSDKLRNSIGLILAMICAGVAFWFERTLEGSVFLSTGILIFSIAPSDDEEPDVKIVNNLPEDTWSR